MNVDFFVSDTAVVKPGQNVCRMTSAVKLGDGVYCENDYVKSSRLGRIESIRSSEETLVSVRGLQLSKEKVAKSESLKLGDKVIGKVVKINEGWARVRLISINDLPVSHELTAVLKRENMRSYDIDSIETEQLVCPGDVLLAKVKSLNESKNVLLTIEEESLGVIFSHSENRNLLVPISKDRMQSPMSKKEFRKKVACLSMDE